MGHDIVKTGRDRSQRSEKREGYGTGIRIVLSDSDLTRLEARLGIWDKVDAKTRQGCIHALGCRHAMNCRRVNLAVKVLEMGCIEIWDTKASGGLRNAIHFEEGEGIDPHLPYKEKAVE